MLAANLAANCLRLLPCDFYLLSPVTVCFCSKSILEEYCEISSLLTEEIVKVHQEISAAVEQIDPLVEYQQFIDAYRSEGDLSLGHPKYTPVSSPVSQRIL